VLNTSGDAEKELAVVLTRIGAHAACEHGYAGGTRTCSENADALMINGNAEKHTAFVHADSSLDERTVRYQILRLYINVP
jgi:hypothetical protein